MIEFQATYFDGKSSRAYPSKVYCDHVTVHVKGSEGLPDLTVPVDRCSIAPPLGSTRRSIALPDGGLIETEDFAAVDALERLTGGNRAMRKVHFLESRWTLAAICLIALILSFFAFTRYGVPIIARKVAYSIPARSMEQMSRDAIKVLDAGFLSASALPPWKRREVSALFGKVGREMAGMENYRIEFRRGRGMGANALALPSGTIVVTDELVKLARNDRELAGVFAHEMAHVKHRHSLRQVLQSAGVFFLLSAMMGDIASVSSTAASLPTLLVQTGYSREFEREADREAGLYSIRKGWGTGPYREMLGRLTKGAPATPQIPLLSTHPPLAERLKNLDELEKKAGR
jgi:Zn-dependent protease with chaperone function